MKFGIEGASKPERHGVLQRLGWRSLPVWAKTVLSTGAAAVIASGGWFLNEHRTIALSDLVSPVYWYHRLLGQDLYDAATASLMHGNRSLHEVALTFDDGPHRDSCQSILNTLRANHIHATFFDVGERMAQSPNLVRETLADGNEIGDHTFTHPRLVNVSRARQHLEINDTDITYYRITGQHLALIRPPGMRFDPQVLRLTHAMGYITVGYNTDAHDYDPRSSPEFIARRTLDRVENGSIILLHDYPHPAEALPRIVASLKARGYTFVTISQMLAHLPPKPRRAALAFLAAHADPAKGAAPAVLRLARAGGSSVPQTGNITASTSRIPR
ncbi:MAG: polysaccharide deacetylase family protein [Armatimonadetes bacterium]|nr:polysaccharide deacetylase family protein [Armatimonadota bacterium]MDE2207030.1 polysaccharide deacetylase family protein [Armatimonadota bacterium]